MSIKTEIDAATNEIIERIASATRWSRGTILANRSSALGRTEKLWRCGRNGTISEGTYDCSCDSMLCDLGEWVEVRPYKEVVDDEKEGQQVDSTD